MDRSVIVPEIATCRQRGDFRVLGSLDRKPGAFPVARRLVALICASAMLVLAAMARAADRADVDACLAQCRTVYEACWRAAVTYEGYMACYRRANACSEGCSTPPQPH
jgi:hypothetical protein